MKRRVVANVCVFLAFGVLSMPSVLLAERETLGVAPVEPTPALAASVAKDGKNNQMDQVLQSLDGRLLARIQSGGKLQLAARGDLKIILTEQALANSGNVDANDKAAAQQFKLAGAKYVLVTKVDGFKDYSESSTVAETGQNVSTRVLSLSAVATIYDSTSGKVYASPVIPPIRRPQHLLSLNRGKENAALSDELLVGIAGDMAVRIASRVEDVFFPARVTGKTDKQVTINRNDTTDIAVGQVWDVYALREEMFDPDTKVSLGREEVKVGEVRINAVRPNFSTALVIGEDRGIAYGAILRKQESQ